jgi:hypothetical protein
MAALLAIPRGEILKLLDATGVPHRAADTDADVRTKCAAAAWAAEKIRSSADVRALAPGVQDRMLTSFEVPTAWRPEARHQALVNLLQICHNATWSLDPLASHGLVHQERSELFRLVERLATSSLAGASAPDQLLSASEQAKFRSSLAAAGYSDSDVVRTQGRWSLGSGGRPLPAPARSTCTEESALKI